MSLLVYFASIISIIFEALVIDTFFNSVSQGRKFKKIETLIIYCFFTILLSLAYIFIETTIINLILLFIMIVATSFIYKMSKQNQIFFIVIIFIAINLIELLVGFILSSTLKITVTEVLHSELYFIVGVISSKLLTYALIKVFNIFYKKNDGGVKKNLFILFLVFPILTLFVGVVLIGIIGVNSNHTVSIIGALSIILLALSNILIFYLFEQNAKQMAQAYRSNLINESLSIEKQYLKKLIDAQNKSDGAEHDLKNQLFAIAGLLKENNVEAQEAIETICENIIQKHKMVYINNISIDALINNKNKIMLANDIKFAYEIFISSFGNINDIDICVVIGNLIDNAIEACILNKESSNNKIILSIKDDNDYVKLLIRNKVDEKVLIKNNCVSTKKINKNKHGFGIENSKKIVQKYEGDLILDCEENWFSALAIMKKQT